jgi:hypothetical protein
MKKSIKLEAVGSKIEIIGGSIYPKEESWHFQCQDCGAWHTAKLWFDDEAVEFSLTILLDRKEEETQK